ncbi:hypothetical protein PFISCL1PPCAC_6312, partial [Pristionchus fissidentatus]
FDDELFEDSESSEKTILDNETDNDEISVMTDTKNEHCEAIRKLIKDVMETRKFSQRDVISIEEAVIKGCESKWTQGEENILVLLAEMATMEWCEGSKAVTRLLASVAARIRKEKKDDWMWNIFQTHCDQTCFCVLECVRVHGCLVMTECLRISNEMADEEGESQEDETDDLLSSEGNPSQKDKLYNFIPRLLVERWAKVLSQRRFDKSSAVRAIAVSAVSNLPHTLLLDYLSNQFLPNDAVLESLRDVDVKVREAAIKSLSLLSVDHIEESINRLKAEEKIELRRLLAAKLIQEVHVMSFTEEQRTSLLPYLYNNKDKILSRMARERLIPKWEEEQDGDSALNSLFGVDDEEALGMYISTLFADDLKKSENAWEFVEIIKEENPEMITRENWDRSMIRLTAEELSYGVLLLESTFNVLKEVGELSSCLTRLVPSLSDVCRSIRKVAVSWLSVQDSDRREERLMVRILKIVALFDRGDPDGMCEWESLIRYLILNPDLKPSRALIDLCMDQLIRVFGVEETKRMEMRDWAVREMEDLLFEEGVTSDDDALKWKCSLILLSLVKCLPSIDDKTAEMATKLIEETFASEWDMQRELTCTLIAIIGCVRKDWIEGTMMMMLKTALEVDIESTKIVCLRGLIDLISIHSPSTIASFLFPEWEEEVITREMKLYQLFDEYTDPTSKSSLSECGIACSLRLLHEWTPPTPVSLYNLLLFTTRENEGERAALEKAIHEEIQRKARMSRSFRLLLAHSAFSLMERQKGEEAYKCSITSTLMKIMMMMREGREGEEGEEGEMGEWLVPTMILDSIIQDPESSLNRSLVSSLSGLTMTEGSKGMKMVVKKMETAIDRLAIYEESATSKLLIKILEKMDGRPGKRKRKVVEKKSRGRKRIKREEEEERDEEMPSEGTVTHDEYSFVE